MKKALVASILGVALSAASSYGQGYVIMQNYDLVGSTPVSSPVKFANGEGVGPGSGIQVELYYSSTGAAGSYALVSGSLTSFFGVPSAIYGAGVFFGPTVTIPGYTSGDAFFYVQAVGPGIVPAEAQSAVFSIPLQNNNALPPGDILDLGGPNGTTIQGMQSFYIGPEPSTFTLGCLAGALMIFRRWKQVGFSDKNNLNPQHS